MPNLTTVLREEIQRLARREVKLQLEPIKRAGAHYRREIAKLKRMLQEQARNVAALESAQGKQTSQPTDSQVTGARFSSRSVRAQRSRLGLSAEEYGALVGVSAQTVYFWEQGKTRPRAAQFAALVDIRGIGKREAKKRLATLGSQHQNDRTVSKNRQAKVKGKQKAKRKTGGPKSKRPA